MSHGCVATCRWLWRWAQLNRTWIWVCFPAPAYCCSFSHMLFGWCCFCLKTDSLFVTIKGEKMVKVTQFLFLFSSTHQPASARSRSRSNIAQEGEAEASSQESLQELVPEEVLVISLGTGPQTVPGMMSENEVMWLDAINSVEYILFPVSKGKYGYLENVQFTVTCVFLQCYARYHRSHRKQTPLSK